MELPKHIVLLTDATEVKLNGGASSAEISDDESEEDTKKTMPLIKVMTSREKAAANKKAKHAKKKETFEVLMRKVTKNLRGKQRMLCL
jgi:hypothetical protein